MRALRLSVVLLSFVAGVVTVPIGPASAEDVLIGFRTPSGNINCQYASDSNGTFLRCDLLANDAPIPRRPTDCDLDYGNAFEMTPRGRAGRICVGDTTASSDNSILDYAMTWKRGGFTCTSALAGLTCKNQAKRGFFLSRKAQRLF